MKRALAVVKATQVFDDDGSTYWETADNFTVCSEGVAKVFDCPKGVCNASFSFYLKDPKVPNTAECTFENNPCTCCDPSEDDFILSFEDVDEVAIGVLPLRSREMLMKRVKKNGDFSMWVTMTYSSKPNNIYRACPHCHEALSPAEMKVLNG